MAHTYAYLLAAGSGGDREDVMMLCTFLYFDRDRSRQVSPSYLFNCKACLV